MNCQGCGAPLQRRQTTCGYCLRGVHESFDHKYETNPIQSNEVIRFLMTDETYHLPKAGLKVTGYMYCGGKKYPLVNKVEEISMGFYQLRRTQGEMNTAVMSYFFSAKGCNTVSLFYARESTFEERAKHWADLAKFSWY